MLTAVTAGWLLLTQRRGPRIVHYLGLLALIAVLIVHNPLFGFFGISGYLAADAFPGRWMYAGVVWTAIWVGTSQVGGIPLPDSTPVYAWLGVVAVNIVVACLLMAYGMAIEGRNRQLKEALAENDALAREAGIQEERRRMAGEIHDTLAQGLTGIVAQLEALEHSHNRGGDWRRHLDTAAQLARESLSEARRSVRAIGPRALEDARLPDAIADVARSWSSINGIEAEVVTTGDGAPDAPRRRGHAAARGAGGAGQRRPPRRAPRASASRSPTWRTWSRSTCATTAPASRPTGRAGFGLTAMRQRIERLDGRLVVESEPGGGTAVCATVPAREADVISLLIVDDHPVVRDGLRALFTGDDEFEVLGEAADGRRAVALAEARRPDVVLMDLRMPGGDGVTAIRELTERLPEIRVLVLTTYDTDSDVLPAIEAGATGFMLKDAPRDELIRAVRAAAAGESVLSPAVATRLIGQVRAPAEEPLSARELDVLRLVARGATNRERRRAALHQRGDGQDAPAAHLRQARRQRPRGGGGDGVRDRAASPGRRLAAA